METEQQQHLVATQIHLLCILLEVLFGQHLILVLMLLLIFKTIAMQLHIKRCYPEPMLRQVP